jgi:uncharacterized coiled-coil protein SlyX
MIKDYNNELLNDCAWFADKHRGKNKTSGAHWSTIIRFTPLFDEAARLQQRVDTLEVRLAASENDLVLIEVNEMLKKTQARVQELEEQLSFFTEKTDAKYPEMPSEKSINFIPPESEGE